MSGDLRRRLKESALLRRVQRGVRDCGSNAGTDMASERSPWAIEDVLDGNAEDLLQFFE